MMDENERDDEQEDEDDRALSSMVENNDELNCPEIMKLDTLNKFLSEDELASTDKIYLIYEKLLEEVR